MANGELWNVLFSVTAGSARDLVQDCRQDGRRALLRLRFEYRAGETQRSVRELESMLSRAKLSESESPAAELRDIVQAHTALKKTQAYRDEDMLQRAILQALDVEAYHTLHMLMESRVDAGISTTTLIHEVQQYYNSYVSRRSTSGAAALATPLRPCDVCNDGTHWLRFCPVIIRAKELVQEDTRAAEAAEATAVATAAAAAQADFWGRIEFDESGGDGSVI